MIESIRQRIEKRIDYLQSVVTLLESSQKNNNYSIDRTNSIFNTKEQIEFLTKMRDQIILCIGIGNTKESPDPISQAIIGLDIYSDALSKMSEAEFDWCYNKLVYRRLTNMQIEGYLKDLKDNYNKTKEV
jgi:hypothetical protein